MPEQWHGAAWRDGYSAAAALSLGPYADAALTKPHPGSKTAAATHAPLVGSQGKAAANACSVACRVAHDHTASSVPPFTCLSTSWSL